MTSTNTTTGGGNWWSSLTAGVGNFVAPLLASADARLQSQINPNGYQMQQIPVGVGVNTSGWLAIAAIGGVVVIAVLLLRK